jgi:hypothetical protein
MHTFFAGGSSFAMALAALGNWRPTFMHRLAFSIIMLVALLPLLAPAPAEAQATRTWVSGVGDDANPCSRTAPCKTFAGAISKTTAGGEISVLDPGGFGQITITKAISLTNDGVGEAGIAVAAGANGITVRAGPNDVINVRGLIFDGFGSGLSGITFDSGAALNVQNCVFRNFGGSGTGITFAPNSASQLFVSETLLSSNGGGILFSAGNLGTANVQAVLNRVQAETNGFGIKAQGSANTAQVNVTVRDSVAAGNSGNGIWVTTPTGGSVNRVLIDRTTAVGNGTGVVSDGGASFTLLNYSTVVENNTGVSVTNGGSLLSYTTNAINDNKVADGAPSGSVALK